MSAKTFINHILLSVIQVADENATSYDSSLDLCGASHETVFQFDIKLSYKLLSMHLFYDCSIQTPLLHRQHLFLGPNV